MTVHGMLSRWKCDVCGRIGTEEYNGSMGGYRGPPRSWSRVEWWGRPVCNGEYRMRSSETMVRSELGELFSVCDRCVKKYRMKPEKGYVLYEELPKRGKERVEEEAQPYDNDRDVYCPPRERTPEEGRAIRARARPPEIWEAMWQPRA